MKYKVYLLFVFIYFTLNMQNLVAQQLPPVKYPGIALSISELKCTELQIALRTELYKNKHWKNLIEKKKMAVGIVDLHDLNNIKFAGVNEDHMMYAASLPKIAVLLAVMRGVNDGEIVETESVKNDLKLMISKSSNAAATRMIDLVGFEKIEETLRNTEHKFYDEESGGGLWVGKRYAKSGKRYPDPLKGLSHGATASMVCGFYYQLAIGRLINRERSAEILEIMKDPALHHKFVNTLNKIAPEATIYRKSGSWKQYHADSALVWGPGRKYIMVALIEDSSGESIIRNLVVPLEKVIEKASRMGCNN